MTALQTLAGNLTVQDILFKTANQYPILAEINVEKRSQGGLAFT